MDGVLRQIGHYTLLRKIGEGSFGCVYLVSEKSGSLAALKIVNRFGDDPKNRESKALEIFYRTKRGRDSGVIDILDSGRTPEENFRYYVMPLADSATEVTDPRNPDWQPQTLESLIETKRKSGKWFTIAEIKEILLPLFSALEFFEGEGLVHRDIKPANILFVNGKAVLADIGLLEVHDDGASRYGTDAYRALSGYKGNPDFWSLSAVIYTLMTGNNPDSWANPKTWVMPCGLEKMSAREIAAYRHWRGRIIDRATSFRPADLYRSASEFKRDFFNEQLKKKSSLPLIANIFAYAALLGLAGYFAADKFLEKKELSDAKIVAENEKDYETVVLYDMDPQNDTLKIRKTLSDDEFAVLKPAPEACFERDESVSFKSFQKAYRENPQFKDLPDDLDQFDIRALWKLNVVFPYVHDKSIPALERIKALNTFIAEDCSTVITNNERAADEIVNFIISKNKNSDRYRLLYNRYNVKKYDIYKYDLQRADDVDIFTTEIKNDIRNFQLDIEAANKNVFRSVRNCELLKLGFYDISPKDLKDKADALSPQIEMEESLTKRYNLIADRAFAYFEFGDLSKAFADYSSIQTPYGKLNDKFGYVYYFFLRAQFGAGIDYVTYVEQNSSADLLLTHDTLYINPSFLMMETGNFKSAVHEMDRIIRNLSPTDNDNYAFGKRFTIEHYLKLFRTIPGFEAEWRKL